MNLLDGKSRLSRLVIARLESRGMKLQPPAPLFAKEAAEAQRQNVEFGVDLAKRIMPDG